MRTFSRLLLLLAFASVVTACSGGSSSQPNIAGNGTPMLSQTAVNDVPADSRHILYPPVGLQHVEAHRGGGGNNLAYNGGATMTVPKVYVVFWGWTGDPSGEATYLVNFLSGVGGSSWEQTVTQYYSISGGNHVSITNPAGQLGGYEYDTTNAIPSRPTDTQIAAEAARAAAYFGISGSNVMVMVATPHGNSTRGFGTSWCAYHSYTTTGSGNLAYTNLPYQTDAGASCGEDFVNGGSAGLLDGVSVVGGHEFAESITDPYPSSGWLDRNGNEIGDKCAWSSASTDITLSTGKFAVQPLWSNASSGCVVSY